MRLAGYAGLNYRPGTRWSAGLAAHLFDPDVQVNGQTSSALEATFNVFPRAHFELAGTIRAEAASVERGTLFGLLQLHYFL